MGVNAATRALIIANQYWSKAGAHPGTVLAFVPAREEVEARSNTGEMKAYIFRIRPAGSSPRRRARGATLWWSRRAGRKSSRTAPNLQEWPSIASSRKGSIDEIGGFGIVST